MFFFNLNYFIAFILIWITLFLINVNYNLYEYKIINNKLQTKISSNIIIKHSLYKDNYMVVYVYDKETANKWYVVIWVWKWVDHCEKRGKYNICTWGNKELWPTLSTFMYSSIN